MASISSSMAREEGDSAVPTFDTLISHLLSAKRSLSCVEHVSRANSLVTSTRQVLEHHMTENARVDFLHAGSIAQTQVLQQIQRHTQGIYQESISEFSDIMKDFEVAEARLNSTLEQLRAAIVERSLRPDEEERKSLADFVDESAVLRLKENVQESVNAFQEARQDFDKNTTEFDEEVTEARDLLTGGEQFSTGKTAQNPGISPLLGMLQRMEEHAHGMANNLESLVKHFDLCITAIKHTDGGATASQITDELPEAVRLQLDQNDPLEPIDPEERLEMLEVIQKDAGEVDDVVGEIKNSLAEMEAEHEQIDRFSDQLSSRSERTASALRLLDDVGTKLPKYLTQSQLFVIRWDEEKAKIQELMGEFDGLGSFYDEFFTAYNSLIIEVGRRKDTEKRIAKVRSEALARIDEILADEQAERNDFRQAQGDFLPVDIWPGLMTSPARYQFIVEEGTEDSIPDISASTINRAIRHNEAIPRDSLRDN